MDPSRGEGGGGEGDGPGAPRAGGLGRAQMLRNLSLRTPGERESSSTASTGRGALLRGMAADSTVGESSVTSQGPLAAAGGRGALLRTLSGAGGATSQSSASSSSVALSRQELMAKLNKNRAEAAVLPKPIGRAGLVSVFQLLVCHFKFLVAIRILRRKPRIICPLNVLEVACFEFNGVVEHVFSPSCLLDYFS